MSRHRPLVGSPAIRFLAGVLSLWIGGRILLVGLGDLPPMIDVIGTPLHAGGYSSPRAEPPVAEERQVTVLLDPPRPGFAVRFSPVPASPAPEGAGYRDVALVPAAYRLVGDPARGRSIGGFSPAFVEVAPRDTRWSGSAWAYFREGSGQGSGSSLATGGQLGGSQAGLRLAYRINDDLYHPVALTMRATSPVERRGAEIALGIEGKPFASLPVRVALSRRIGLDRAGRDAWELMLAGGVYDRRLPGGLRLDGYAQAGVVGARRRDLFADGALRVGRPLPVGRDASLTIGGGVWGAAQPGVERLDLGPSAVLRAPLGKTAITAALDWRIRVAGDASPNSGVALTLAGDF